jgi:hypothetical protein
LVKGGSAHSLDSCGKNGWNASNCNFESAKALEEIRKNHSSDMLNGIKSEKTKCK